MGTEFKQTEQEGKKRAAGWHEINEGSVAHTKTFFQLGWTGMNRNVGCKGSQSTSLRSGLEGKKTDPLLEEAEASAPWGRREGLLSVQFKRSNAQMTRETRHIGT